MCFFTCSPRPPTLSQRHMDLHVWAYPRPGYIFQVSSKSVQGFRSPRGQNLTFPITLASRFYNSLYYRISRDVSTMGCVRRQRCLAQDEGHAFSKPRPHKLQGFCFVFELSSKLTTASRIILHDSGQNVRSKLHLKHGSSVTIGKTDN